MTADHVRLLPKRKTDLGWAITTVHYSVLGDDFDYDGATQGMDAQTKQIEMEIDWDRTHGKVCWGDLFDRSRHVARQKLVYDPDLVLSCCWDIPGCPAFVPTQVNHYGQWLIYPPVTQPESDYISVYEFGQRVANHLQQEYAAPFDLDLEELDLAHYGDPAGNMKPQQTAGKRQETRSAFEVLQHGSRLYVGDDPYGRPLYEEKPGWGWRIFGGAVDTKTRIDSVRSRLATRLPGGYEAVVVCPDAEAVIAAMVGGYHYEEYNDGTFSRDPVKNQASHLSNALEYGCTRLFVKPIDLQKKRQGESYRQQQGYVSQASSQRGRGYR